MRHFTCGDHAPEGDEQLAGECDDHFRLACAVSALGPRSEPLRQGAILLEQQEPPGELDHATTHAAIARLGEAFFASLGSAFVRRAGEASVAGNSPTVAQV